MPIYEYHCDACDLTFDALQKITDDPLTDCRSCGGPVTKLVSLSGFQFKGSGWYVTDYAHRSGSGSKTEETTPEKPAEAAESGTKPEKKDTPAKSTDTTKDS